MPHVDAEAAAEELRKRLGSEAVSTTASAPAFAGSVVSTGSLGLDAALGVGGLPMGRVVEVYGPESSGKTTLTLHVLANAQAEGMLCGFVDAEHAIDLSYASRLGVDPSKLLLAQPDTGEAGLNTVKEMLDVGVRVIVVDSVSALTPKAEIEGDIGDSHVGLQARMMGQALRMIAGATRRRDALVIFINQLRHKIGIRFGSPDTTSGGNALKFFASVRIDVRNIGKIKRGGELHGHRCRLRVVKNKVAPPFQEVEVDLVWGEGYQLAGQLVDIGAELGVLSKRGAHYAWGDVKIAHGRQATIDALTDDKKLRAKLTKAIRKAMP